MGSTPSLTEFNPKLVAWQYDTLKYIRKEYDYEKHGVLELLLSGSLGSAKTILMAHLGVTHCLMYPQARFLLGRKALPDLKQTLISKILEHMDGDLTEGIDFEFNKSESKFVFANGSEMISRTWHDKNFKKFRSLDISAAAIEELTENDDNYKEFYIEMIGRVGRLMHVPENFCICATNPDDPAHWVHDYFMIDGKALDNRQVHYSKTSDNIFLPKWYIPSLRQKYDEKMCKRLIDGLWVSIASDFIYYEYESNDHFILKDTQVNQGYPIAITFDFNIGEGKPMSALLGQHINDIFYCIDEFIVEGARTRDIMDEIAGRGYFDLEANPMINIYGDASGKHRDTRSQKSDYDIIEKYLANYVRKDDLPLNYELDIPLANPPVRTRHNLVNGKLRNAEKKISLFIDKRCRIVDEGMRKTKLKQGGKYIEDDSRAYQHVTTALGYWVHRVIKAVKTAPIIQGYA